MKGNLCNLTLILISQHTLLLIRDLQGQSVPIFYPPRRCPNKYSYTRIAHTRTQIKAKSQRHQCNNWMFIWYVDVPPDNTWPVYTHKHKHCSPVCVWGATAKDIKAQMFMQFTKTNTHRHTRTHNGLDCCQGNCRPMRGLLVSWSDCWMVLPKAAHVHMHVCMCVRAYSHVSMCFSTC